MKNIRKIIFAAVFLLAHMAAAAVPCCNACAQENGSRVLTLNGMMQEDFLLDIEVDIYNEHDPSFEHKVMLTQENGFHEEMSLQGGTYSIVCYSRERDISYSEDVWVVSNYDGVPVDLTREDQQVNILCGDYEFLMAYDGVIYNPGGLGGYVSEETVQKETERLISEYVYEEITEDNFEEIAGAEKEDPVIFPSAQEPENGRTSAYLLAGMLAAAVIVSGGIVLLILKRGRARKREETEMQESIGTDTGL